MSFYNITINNWFDFKSYQADFDILPVSPYTYEDDVKQYKDNATLGVGKLDYIIASGTKQRHINDMFELEKFLHLDHITPMQTSYTQTAEDRAGESEIEDTTDHQSTSGIEPSEEKSKSEASENKVTNED